MAGWVAGRMANAISIYANGGWFGKPKQEITRLFNLHHATKIDAVQLAAKALGKELSLVMV